MNNDAPKPSGDASSWRDVPLQAGNRCLIEASAGTGKTWTISVIYLRLLLEQGLSPTQIVVTTFTDAAAQELRERIRGRILWAVGLSTSTSKIPAANYNDLSIDDDELWLRQRWLNEGDAFDSTLAAADHNLLRLALVDLDRTPISTLHSLCRRILSELPFDSASAFNLGDMVSTDSINDELIDDLIRRLGQGVAELSEGEAAWWSDRKALRAVLRKALEAGITVEMVSEAGIAELKDHENLAVLDAAISDVPSYTRANSALLSGFKALRQFIAGDALDEKTGKALGRLAETLEQPLEERLKRDARNRDACEKAYQFATGSLAALTRFPNVSKSRALKEFQTTLREQRQQRLSARGHITFDALIERVARVLDDPDTTLADALFQRWPVALVDEFQDTDAQQYAILDTIYRDRDTGQLPRGLLVMIGDPKQAIYRFRGGDIEAYLNARTTATSTLKLDTNFRSSASLVGAINNVFERAGMALSSKRDHPIMYENVVASSRNDKEPYRTSGKICATPLHVHYWHEDVPDAASHRISAALEACANQIVDLLASGDHAIGDELLKPGDIAVLLPTNGQINELRRLLDERHVPCVATARSSVFDSDWARELQIVLHAALYPRDPGAVRAALATRLGGKSYQDLRNMGNDPAAFERESRPYASMGEAWRSVGVLAAIQGLLRERGSDLFAAGDAERAITDLNHLGELLQAQADQRIGGDQLLYWLGSQRNDGEDDAGEAADGQQLRIESDAARVRLMTLHASKGLEFPIVILPLMWASTNRDTDKIPVLHDPASGQRVLSFGDDALGRFQWNGQDERYRLLYVALTRAQHACHVYALPHGRATDAGSSKPRTDPKRSALDAIIERLLGDRVAPKPMAGVAWSTGPWPHADASNYQPLGERTLAQRVAMSEPRLAAFESRYSFTSLTHTHAHVAREEASAADEPDSASDASQTVLVDDVEQNVTSMESAHPELQRLFEIAGADFGNALHAIFEHRVIGETMATQTDLIRRCLGEYAVAWSHMPIDRLVALVATRLQATIDAPLLPQWAPGLSLAALKPHQMRAEMAFDFVLDDVSMTQLREACAIHGEPALVPEGPTRNLRGLMTGKIDLVFEFNGRFYVLDYKSNRLGERMSDYAADALERAMDASRYRFQALLYTVAVDRYLRQRIANYSRREHLGAAIYLFVRATGIVGDSGIWARRFDDRLIDAVDAALGRSIQERIA